MNLDAVRHELQTAHEHVVAMEVSEDLPHLEQHWKAFLHAIERVWFKACATLSGESSWHGRKGRYVAQRRKDPLLSYLQNARGAEEHTVAEITTREPESIGIGAGPTGSAYIHRLTIREGTIDFQGQGSLAITFTPARVLLLPVVNRGVNFEVPTAHLGKSLPQRDAIAVARTGYEYYSRFVRELERLYRD